MKVAFTPEADRQVANMDAWWRLHRPDSPGLFARELAEATGLIRETHGIGSLYVTRSGLVARGPSGVVRDALRDAEMVPDSAVHYQRRSSALRSSIMSLRPADTLRMT